MADHHSTFTLASPFSSEFPPLCRTMRTESFEASDNEDFATSHQTAQNLKNCGLHPSTSPNNWVFHSPPSSVSVASPSLLNGAGFGNDRSDNLVSSPTLCNGNSGVRRSLTFSESHDSFLSSDDCPDAVPNICSTFNPDVSDHLLEFVLRLTDTPPECHRLERCMTEDAINPRRTSSVSTLLDDLPLCLGSGKSLDSFSNQFDSSLFSSDSHDGTQCMNLYTPGASSSSNNYSRTDATCRSTLSLISNTGSFTTAASTPSGTPTWSQDLSTPSGVVKNQSSSLQEPSLLDNRLLCSPLSGGSETPKGTIEDLLSDDDSVGRRDNYFQTGFLRLVDSEDPLPLRTVSKSELIAGSGCSNRTSDSLPFQASPQSRASLGLRHLHSSASQPTNCFIQAAAGGDDDYTRGSSQPGGSGGSNYRGFNEGNWEENRDRNNHRERSSNGGINKGLTDFYSFAYASKRWQNLNVVLPLFIPHGVIAVIRSTGENTYVFPDQYPASQLLFSGSGKICDMWSTYLRLRVAVIHKCPEFLVPRVAQVFNSVLASLPKFSEPIHLRCAGMVKHSIQLRSSGGLTYRYDTIGQISNAADQDKMRVLFEGLQNVMSSVNHYLAREMEDVFRSLQGRNEIDDSNIGEPNRNPKCGLEFRFSPCKELKIAIREGTVCDCAGVDSMIAGGGASSMSAWAQQFVVENLIVGELRLERDKTSETQLDPFFLPHAEVKTRMISKDLDGNPARISFVDPAVYPEYYRPRVEYAIGLTPLQAAEQLVGATHSSLAKLLPSGMSSLTTTTSQSLHIPGLPQLFGGSSSVPVTPYYGERNNSMTGARQPFGQTSSSYSSPTPSGPSDPSWSSIPPSDQRQDPFYRSNGWNLPDQHNSPISGGEAEALKGLAVLQKMLSNMNLGESNNKRTLSSVPDKAADQFPQSSSQNSQQLQTAISQAAMALGRHHESLSRTPEACALLSQLQSALQSIPYIAQQPTEPSQLSFPSNDIFDIESMEDINQTNKEEVRGSKSVDATPANHMTCPDISSPEYVSSKVKPITTTMEGNDSSIPNTAVVTESGSVKNDARTNKDFRTSTENL